MATIKLTHDDINEIKQALFERSDSAIQIEELLEVECSPGILNEAHQETVSYLRLVNKNCTSILQKLDSIQLIDYDNFSIEITK